MTNERRTDDARREAVTLFTQAVQELLQTNLPNDYGALKKSLIDTESRYIGILTERIKAQSKLSQERNRLRYPKDKELTDWDRKIMLDASTAELQVGYDLLAGMEKALEQRIEVIRTLLIQ